MLVDSGDRVSYLRNIFLTLNNGGSFLLVNMGDGSSQRATSIDDAFSITERMHQVSGVKVKVASTSCRIVNEDSMVKEVESAGFKVDKFLHTQNSSFGQCMTLYLNKK